MSSSSSGVFDVLVRGLFIDLEEAVELQNAAGSAEQIILGGDFDAGLIVDGRVHLRCDETRPDQPVELVFIFGKKRLQVVRRAADKGRTNRFVSVLRVLLALVDDRLFGKVRSPYTSDT